MEQGSKPPSFEQRRISPWTYHVSFTHSPADGHGHRFYLSIVNNTATQLGVQIAL